MPPHSSPPPALSPTTTLSPHTTAPASALRAEEELRGSGAEAQDAGAYREIDPKTGRRRVVGRRKGDMEAAAAAAAHAAAAPAVAPPGLADVMPQTHAAVRPMELKAHPQPIPLSPSRLHHPSIAAASPSRLRSSSPRLHSPASSEIFERNVQEPVPLSTLQSELTPAHIPSHVITEDHIPAALEASAQAITSEELNPDEVEIVTSSFHQPAAEKVLEASASHADLTSLQSLPLRHHASDASEGASSFHALQTTAQAENDTASTYGQLDPNDVRRLSFISFADIVQSEHDALTYGDIGSRDSLHLAGSIPTIPERERAGSPLRSPRSPGSLGSGMTTPPPGLASAPLRPQEGSPARSGSGLVGSGSVAGQHGELNIETMRQAVRKTASGDLSGVRSAGAMSPMSEEGGNGLREARSRTNT